jgi:ATP-binding cassette, subfamily B, bacterial
MREPNENPSQEVGSLMSTNAPSLSATSTVQIRQLAKTILPFVLPDLSLILLAVVFIVGGSALAVWPSYILRDLLDAIVVSNSSGTTKLTHLATEFIAVCVAAELANVIRARVVTQISLRGAARLRLRLHLFLQSFSPHFFSSLAPGELPTRILTDASGTMELFGETAVAALLSISVLAFALTAMIRMNLTLACIVVGTLPVFIYPTQRIGRRVFQARDRAQDASVKILDLLHQTFSGSGALLWRMFGCESYEMHRFTNASRDLYSSELSARMVGVSFFAGISAFAVALPGLIYWAGGREVIAGRMSVGEVVAFAALTLKLFQPVMQLLRLNSEAQKGLVHASRVAQVLNLEPDAPEDGEAIEPAEAARELECRNVFFRYSPGDREVLHDVSFRLEPGKIVALVGQSGAGKSTIAALAVRMFDPDRGQILINGIDRALVSRRWLARQISIVTQDVYLFDGTIRANLGYANLDATDEQIEQAARDVDFHEAISGLPEGYNSLVGVGGWKLSGGERQRIAIARAILRDAPILILDEATASLDAIRDASLRALLAHHMRDRTTLVISHRGSNVRDASEILVLEDGQIVQRGRHATLVCEGGLYSRLSSAGGENSSLPGPTAWRGALVAE